MQLRTEIAIEAPARRVWDVLTDFDAYREWNPFIGRISGDLTPGSKLRLEVSPSAGRSLTLRARVTVVRPDEELAWRVSHMPVPGLIEGVHCFRLSEPEPGTTRFVQGEDFSGLLVKSNPTGLTSIARAFVAMNQALRERVQALTR
jgi:hypothetical protein